MIDKKDCSNSPCPDILKDIVKITEMDLSNKAFEETKGLNFDETPIFASNEAGAPVNLINVEALDGTPRAFWKFHERKLWTIIIICGLYFLVVVL